MRWSDPRDNLADLRQHLSAMSLESRELRGIAPKMVFAERLR